MRNSDRPAELSQSEELYQQRLRPIPGAISELTKNSYYSAQVANEIHSDSKSIFGAHITPIYTVKQFLQAS